MRSAIDERYQYPANGGTAQVGNTNLNLGWLGHIPGPVAHPVLPGLIRSREMEVFALIR